MSFKLLCLLAVVIVLGLGALFLLFFYCHVKGSQAIHVTPYESYQPTLFVPNRCRHHHHLSQVNLPNLLVELKLPGLVQNSLVPGIGRSYSPFGLRMPTDMWSLPDSSLIKASIRYNRHLSRKIDCDICSRYLQKKYTKNS